MEEREKIIAWHRALAARHRAEADEIASKATSGMALVYQTSHPNMMADFHEACAAAIERGDHIPPA